MPTSQIDITVRGPRGAGSTTIACVIVRALRSLGMGKVHYHGVDHRYDQANEWRISSDIGLDCSQPLDVHVRDPGAGKETVWVAGVFHHDDSFPHLRVMWQIIGVFSTEANAVAACKHANQFIGPLTMDEVTPEPPTDWPGAYYPIRPNPKEEPCPATAHPS